MVIELCNFKQYTITLNTINGILVYSHQNLIVTNNPWVAWHEEQLHQVLNILMNKNIVTSDNGGQKPCVYQQLSKTHMCIQAQLFFPSSILHICKVSIERLQPIHGLILDEDIFFTLSFVAYMTIDYNSKHLITTCLGPKWMASWVFKD